MCLCVGVATLSACGGSGSDTRHDGTTGETPLHVGPPPNVIKDCRNAAQQTALETVYCPPVAPIGATEIYPKEQHSTGFGEKTYFMSFRSRSLAHSPRAFARHPEEGHWVIAAERPFASLRASVDLGARYARAHSRFREGRRSVTVHGVRMTVLTGNTEGAGFASSGHAIAYWQIDGTGYLVSVHYPENAPIVEQMARGLIKQIIECSPRSPSSDASPPSCRWVFEGRSAQ